MHTVREEEPSSQGGRGQLPTSLWAPPPRRRSREGDANQTSWATAHSATATAIHPYLQNF